MTLTLSKPMTRKVTLFVLVGGSVFLGGQAALVALVEFLYWNATFANVLVQATSVWICYRLNRKYTWDGATSRAQAQRFVLSRLLTMLLSLALFRMFVTMGMYYLWASAFGVIASMAVNFVIADRWVFSYSRRHGTTRADEDLKLGLHSGITIMAVLAFIVSATRIGLADLFIPMLMVQLSVIALLSAGLFLVSLLYPHRHEESNASQQLRAPTGPSRERFAVLLPARNEMEVLGETILTAFRTQWEHSSHRFFPVICYDDSDTIRRAMAAAEITNRPRRRGAPPPTETALNAHLYQRLSAIRFDGSPLSVSEHQRIDYWRATNAMTQIILAPVSKDHSSKPRQMNYAFRSLQNDGFTAFTILDSESKAQEGLFRYVDQAFQDHPEVSVIQGPVQLMDPTYRGSRWHKLLEYCRRWYSWHNLLEYHRWFSGQMAFQSKIEFVPLGGNTVFIRSETLKKTNGWPETLTEDCALGIEVSTMDNEKVLTFCNPALATREETPPRIRELRKQRTRWTQGFLQSLLAGKWRSMPTSRQRLLAQWILSGPLFQAMAAPLLPLAIVLTTTQTLKSPPPLVLVMYLPVLAMVVVTALQLKQLHEYGKHYDRKVAWYVYLQVIVTQVPYQMVLSYAAFRAVLRHMRRKINWETPARAGDLLAVRVPVGETSS